MPKLGDRVLAKLGLMRISEQPVKKLQVDDRGLLIEFKSGFRWSGRQDSEFVSKVDTKANPFYWT